MGRGIVYVLTNPSFPHLVKIGITTNLDSRMSSLYSSGVPTPFHCLFAYEVDQYEEVEKALHNALSKYRINKNREFFEVPGERLENLIKLMPNAKLVTDEVEKAIDRNLIKEDKEAEEKEISRNKNFNFREMGISIGSEIVYEDDTSIKAIVVDERKVSYQETIYSLTALTKTLLGKKDYAVRPLVYWSYNGQNLLDLYHRGL